MNRDFKRDIDDELRFHLERKAAELESSGLPPHQAWIEARRKFGSVDEFRRLCESIGKERQRRMHWIDYLASWKQDIRFGLRTLAKTPAFSLLAAAMLSLGVGGATLIFSFYNGLFLRPLPFPHGERLIDLDEVAPKWNLDYTGIAYPDFVEWRSHNQTFESMGLYRNTPVLVSNNGETDRIRAARVTFDMLSTLQMRPALGRGFTKEEDIPNGPKVAMISHSYWQRAFGGKADALGRKIIIDAESYEIVGVLSVDSVLPDRVEFWMPLGLAPSNNGGWFLSGVGRLKADVSMEQAREDLTRIHRGIESRKDVNQITSPRLTPLRDRLVGDLKTAAQLLLTAVAFVLLIACANVAALLLARGAGRDREFGIRLALGAGRMRVVRQLIVESGLLAVSGAAAGVGLGWAAKRALLAIAPPLPEVLSFEFDARVTGFIVALAAVCTLLFGLWPALESTGAGLRAKTSSRRRGGLRALIVVQVALALVLLVGGGLLLQAFRRLETIDPGFQRDGILIYRIAVTGPKYRETPPRIQLADRVLERTRQLPGVQSAALTSIPPLGGHSGTFFRAEGAPPRRDSDPNPVVLQNSASPGYLKAMGIRLIEGRDFSDADLVAGTPPAVVVNEAFAKLHWPNQSAIGKRIAQGDNTWRSIVGVTADIKHYGLEREMRPSVTFPSSMLQGNPVIVLRVAGNPADLTAPSRALLREIEPEAAMFDVRTMEDRLRESTVTRRTYSIMLWAFAGIALLLAVGGMYGVLNYAIGQRSNELGIRMALGAAPFRLTRDVLCEGLAVVGVGLALGAVGAYFVGRAISSLLLGVPSWQPATFGVASLLLLLFAVVANYIPARRVSRIDPSSVLRI